MYYIKIDPETNIILDATSFKNDSYINTNLESINLDIIQGYYKWINNEIVFDEKLKLQLEKEIELFNREENLRRIEEEYRVKIEEENNNIQNKY